MSQSSKLLSLLSDGLPHNTIEIVQEVYAGGEVCNSCGSPKVLSLSRVGARIWDLKQKGHVIKGWRDEDNSALWWYQMEIAPVEIKNVEQVSLI